MTERAPYSAGIKTRDRRGICKSAGVLEPQNRSGLRHVVCAKASKRDKTACVVVMRELPRRAALRTRLEMPWAGVCVVLFTLWCCYFRG
jgi:hypothetical protein